MNRIFLKIKHLNKILVDILNEIKFHTIINKKILENKLKKKKN